MNGIAALSAPTYLGSTPSFTAPPPITTPAADDTDTFGNNQSTDAPGSGQASTAATTSPSANTDTASLAQTVALSALSRESGIVAALFGSQASAGDTGSSSVFFTGNFTNSLLVADGSAALSYLTPQSAPAPTGSTVNAAA
jgi:hypothetical protein